MKIYVEVFGCTANKADASLIKGQIKKGNHEIVNNPKDADALIILTCTVIDTTEQRMLFRIKQLNTTGKKLIVAGCMASIQREKIQDINSNIMFLPAQDSHQILNLLDNEKTEDKQGNKTKYTKYFDDVLAPISIAEGCNFNCSYCITTKARGNLRSFPISEIKEDIKGAISQGCKEIQLTAQDTSSYGLDSNNNLGVLLQSLNDINEEIRIRIGMMNPYTFLKNQESIIKGYKDSKIYKFAHLPVQSGDNKILSNMNRRYTVEEFKKAVKIFRENYPEITIATDIIVGFPTETNEQFQHTIDLLKEIKPDITNITRFSARPFTKAKTMKGRIKTEKVKERSKILSELCSKISKENNIKHIGKKYNVLITEKGKNNTFVGRSGNYKPVVINEAVCIGRFYSVKIEKAASTFLVGSII